MIGAMATLSVPAAFGRPLVLGGPTLGDEPWRLPLEAALLAGCVFAGRLQRPRDPFRR
jgi:hypothetical protein